MGYELATRLKLLPPYLFAEMEEKVAAKRAEGVDIIDFGIGDPDIPTPEEIVRVIQRALEDPANHRYPSSAGEGETRRAVADWYAERFGVDLDPAKQVTILLGSKEGLANICRAFVNPGEKVLTPDPAYPVYAQGGAILSDAVPVRVPLLEDNNFLVDIDSLPSDGRMIYLNYPNNPTGAVAPEDHLRRVLSWSEDTGTIVCYDNAYSEITFNEYRAPSVLQFGENAIEFGSLSKTFNMTGYRLGYAVGNAELITGLRKVKSQIDSGAPRFIQKAAISSLGLYSGGKRPEIVERNVAIYEERMDTLVRGLRRLGLEVRKPKGTFYLWLKAGGDSMEFTERLLRAGVIVTPGIGFGEHGEGFVRLALTQPVERIEEALERMERVI